MSKEKLKVMMQFIPLNKLNELDEEVMNGMDKAMTEWAKIMSEKEVNEFKTNIKLTKGGAINKMNLIDYIEKKSWEVKSFGYSYPGVLEVVMKNVTDTRNPKRIYRQTVSDSYMIQISRKLYGHTDFEKEEHFDETSLIRKHKIV